MISAVVLAAGLSSRMGESKLLLPLGERTVIEQIVFQLFKSGVEEIVVITGHEGDSVADALEGLPVRIVHNFGYAQGGMLSSIKTGIQVVSLGGSSNKNDAGIGHSDCEAFLLCLGDQPSLQRGVVERLIETFSAHRDDEIIIPCHGDAKGHPILIPAAFWQRILALPVESSLRDVTLDKATPVRLVQIENDSILLNINTPEDYKKELARRNARS